MAFPSFGSTPAKATTFGFGQTSAFGAQPASTPQTAAPSPFGSFGAAKPSAAAGTNTTGSGLFGQTPGQANTAAGGLFGQPQQQQQPQQPAAGGAGLFGSTSGATGGFSFGATTNNNAQAGPSSGLFGNSSANINQGSNTAGGSSGGLFNFSGAAGQPAPSLFGGQQQQQAQQSNPISQSLAPSYQQQQQFQQSKPLHRALNGMENMSGTTMYEDLVSRQDGPSGTEAGLKEGPHGAVFKQNLDALEAAFKDHHSQRLNIQVGDLADDLVSDRRRIIRLEGNSTIYFQSLISLTKRVHTLTRQSDEVFAEFARVHGILVSAGSSSGKGIAGEAPRRMYTEFFTKLAIDMDDKMKLFQKTLAQVERQLASLQKDQHLPTAQAIAQAVANNQKSVMILAADIAELETRVKELAVHYRREFRRKNNTALDPIESYRAQQGVPRLSARQNQSGAGFYDELDDLAVM